MWYEEFRLLIRFCTRTPEPVLSELPQPQREPHQEKGVFHGVVHTAASCVLGQTAALFHLQLATRLQKRRTAEQGRSGATEHATKDAQLAPTLTFRTALSALYRYIPVLYIRNSC